MAGNYRICLSVKENGFGSLNNKSYFDNIKKITMHAPGDVRQEYKTDILITSKSKLL